MASGLRSDEYGAKHVNRPRRGKTVRCSSASRRAVLDRTPSAGEDSRCVTKIRLAVTLAATLAISACGTNSAGPVQLDGGAAGDHSTECLPAASAQDFAYGFNVVSNRGKRPVQIISVVVDGLHSMQLLGSWVAPITQMTVFDVMTPWPVDSSRIDPKVRADWNHRITAVGGNRLAPWGANSSWSLVLHLRVTGPDPSLAGVTLRYSDNGSELSTTGNAALVIKPKCS